MHNRFLTTAKSIISSVLASWSERHPYHQKNLLNSSLFLAEYFTSSLALFSTTIRPSTSKILPILGESYTFFMLGNLMEEDKQLNFNRPLLSVRRGSSLADIEKKETANPPSSTRYFPYYKPELKSGPMNNPAAVPFKWEQIPGRPKYTETKLQIKALPPAPPKLPPGHKLSKDSSCSSNSQRGFDGVCISDAYQASEEYDDSSHSEDDGNSTYLDALDSLSRNESFFFNCSSVSGLSGLDHEPAGMESSRPLLDPKTRDFMMGRFLPAAKAAVASETPSQFGSRKLPPVGIEQPKPREVKQTPRYYYTPTSLPQYLEDESEEEEEEEEEDEDGTENISNKLCGLLPRFCQLNPIRGMRAASLPSVRSKVPKKYTNSCIYDECEKAVRDAVYERRRLAIYQKSNLRVGENDLKDELKNHNLQRASLKLDELSGISSLESNSIVPYKSVSHDSLMNKETGFLGIPAASKDFTYEIEQTLCIDSTQIAEYGAINSRSRDRKIQHPGLPDADSLQLLPLPLPKCPSESWLSHALPSISSRRPPSKSFLGPKSLTLKPSAAEPKWEALVKSSSLHNNNLGFPALMRISED